MKQKNTYLLAASFAALASLVLTGCSEDDSPDRHMMDGLHEHAEATDGSHDAHTSSNEGEAHDHASHASPDDHSGDGDHHASTQETKPSDARAVRVVATDFAFEPKTITAAPGEKLYVTLVNKGNAVHMWQIGDRMETHVHTNVGETSSKVVTVPTEPGVYNLVCTTPGHEQLGMVGKLEVRSDTDAESGGLHPPMLTPSPDDSEHSHAH
ncbi:MAG: hypothetical protein CML13_06090 [Puniceicoccaceae bacterium]|nr:hypothetical protein [Puniceicoccaceae bacterium]|tara:strand:- start:15126 stop:15755 length:630 start_codon:yes stop_codon:yes gene_type:complete